MPSLIERMPVRVRLTLAFALAMAIVLAVTGAALYLRLQSELDASINDNLKARADDTAALVRRGSRLRESSDVPIAELEEAFAQVLDARGRVVDTTPQLGEAPVLTQADLSRAAEGPAIFGRRQLPDLEHPSRLLATPIRVRGTRRFVVVGASLEDRDDALRFLLAGALVVGPISLLAASILGYVVAAAALRPVEAMRTEAEAISAAEPSRRLPVPARRDEISRLGETLNEMLGRLERGLERERRFVADASHELRTPLAALKVELELARKRERTREELEHAIGSAEEEVDRLTRLAEDLLVLARSDRDSLPMRATPVDLGELVAAVARRFESRAAASGRGLERDAPERLIVEVDQLRLEQALGNLVDNALRHGGGTVRLRAASTDGSVELHVTDEGAGFPADFLHEAFDRFSRPDESRGRGGTGLGLAIVKVIAAAHGGTAHVSNGAAGGAHAWIVIPQRAA